MLNRDIYLSTNWLYWLSGLLEGEGTFTAGTPSAPRRPRVAISMTDRDVIDRVATLLGSRVYIHKVDNISNHQLAHRTEVVGGSAVALMRLLYPYMGVRRQGQIETAMASYLPLRVVRHKIYHLVSDEVEEFVRYWMAGYLEGEVSFGQIYAVKRDSSPFLEVNSSDEDVILLLQALWRIHFGVEVNVHIRPPRQDGYKAQYHVAAYGVKARAILKEVLPLMGSRRQARIREVLNL
jgi:hypothetical protein